MVVYLFWIVVSVLFTDYGSISFPVEFINEVRSALIEQYRAIYFNYLVRLKQRITDLIIEVLPHLFAETVRQAI